MRDFKDDWPQYSVTFMQLPGAKSKGGARWWAAGGWTLTSGAWVGSAQKATRMTPHMSLPSAGRHLEVKCCGHLVVVKDVCQSILILWVKNDVLATWTVFYFEVALGKKLQVGVGLFTTDPVNANIWWESGIGSHGEGRLRILLEVTH